jgi:ferrous iron transport protein B
MEESKARPRRRRRRRHRGRRFGFGPEAILLVGNLKVGKSTIFSNLIGQRRIFIQHAESGTELAVGRLFSGPYQRIIDAPGFYSLQDRSEDAFLVRDLLVRRQVGAVLLVLDAKNLSRGLKLFLELTEFDLPVTVALNMCDEARQRGLELDVDRLSEILGVAVVSTVATEGRGLGQLRRALATSQKPRVRMDYPQEPKRAVEKIQQLLAGGAVAPRGMAYLLLAGLPRSRDTLEKTAGETSLRQATAIVDELKNRLQRPVDILLAENTRNQAEQLSSRVVRSRPASRATWKERLAELSRKPASGIPIAVLVMFVTYLFVGWFGAGVLVDLLEVKLFGQVILPWLQGWIDHIPWQWVRELLIGDFGLLTVGLVLSLAIVLPVLCTFFFAFALMEDSGYLPRFSLLTDRVLRKLGLNGKGVLPLVMGLSCVTMAVLSTRVLDSPKQRVIATLLLILTVPCAPLLSVMLVLLARLSIWATVIFFGLLLVQFFIVGALANLLIPGKRPDFVLELPPMRAPRLKGTLTKTGHQIAWFLKEAIPYFLLGTFVLFLLDQLGALDSLREGLQPVSVKLLGLREESADVFFMTVVRREAGAALLAQQAASGMYDGVQVVVTLMVMTLMIPCINSVLVMYKERGFWVSSAIMVTVIAYSLLVGGLLNFVLRWLGVQF